METLPFDLKTFPFAAADLKLCSSTFSRWHQVWFRTSVVVLAAILIAWIFHARSGIGLVFPWLVNLWFVNFFAWRIVVGRARQKRRQNAFSSAEVYTVRLDTGAVILSSPHMRRSFPRETISQILDWRGNLLVVIDALTYIAVPPQAFANAPSRSAFLAAAKALISAERPKP